MIPIDAALTDRALLGAALGTPDSWSRWLSVLRGAFGLPLSTGDLEAFQAVSGSRLPPESPVRELWCVAGRRSGKSRIAAAIAVYIAAFIDHKEKLAPGETGFVLTLSPSVSQSQLVFSYCLAFLEASPILRQKIISTTANEIRLEGNIVIATHPNSFRTVRGRSLLACIFDESAYWRSEESASPDTETFRAVLPALATTGGMLIGISSPYRRAGLLFAKHRDHFGKDDPRVLVVQGATELFNPTIDQSIIELARAEDPEAAAAEWDAEFRSDLSALLDDATLDAAIDATRPLELPPHKNTKYVAFADASAGRHDAFAFAIGHKDENVFIADVIRGRSPPFDPESVAAEYAALAKDYGVREVTGDNFSGEWVSQAFKKHGVSYRRSKLVKSALYLEAVSHFMRGVVSIPKHDRLLRELRQLERRTHRSGRDTVDHPAQGSDDYANVLVGALNLAMTERYESVTSHSPPKAIFSDAPDDYDPLVGDFGIRPF